MKAFVRPCRVILSALLILAVLPISACNVKTDPPPDIGLPPGTTPPISAFTPGPSPAQADEMDAPETQPPLMVPRIDSSTARIPITSAIYELFTGTYGYSGPRPLTSKTHGAWLNLADGAADIVFLVAPTQAELAHFAQKAVDIEMKIYGFDGLVFMGNQANPVKTLTSDQIRAIYSGHIGNWAEIGGQNADILVYIRDPESGSQRLFESLVWEGYDMPDFSAMGYREGEIDPNVTQREVVLEADMGEVTESVMLNQYSIGFNIMSYIDSEFSGSELKLFSVDGYAPTTENFTSGDYPFLTTSYVAIRADAPADSPARMLYDWVGSDESYELITQNSTLSVTFSDSVCIRTGVSDPALNAQLAALIVRLDQTRLRREELFPFTLEEIGYLRNGVFALSGRIFKTASYAAYFNAQTWYQGTRSSDDEVLRTFNVFQKDNLALLLGYEKELQRALANQP